MNIVARKHADKPIFVSFWRAEKFLAAESACNEAGRHDESKTICMRPSAFWVLKLILDLGIMLLTKHSPFVSCSGAFDYITWSSPPGLGSWDAGGERSISVTLRWIAKEINPNDLFLQCHHTGITLQVPAKLKKSHHPQLSLCLVLISKCVYADMLNKYGEHC